MITAANKTRAARAEADHPAKPEYSFQPKIDKVSEELATALQKPGVAVGDRVYNRGIQMQARKEKRIQEEARRTPKTIRPSPNPRAKSATRARPKP